MFLLENITVFINGNGGVGMIVIALFVSFVSWMVLLNSAPSPSVAKISFYTTGISAILATLLVMLRLVSTS